MGKGQMLNRVVVIFGHSPSRIRLDFVTPGHFEESLVAVLRLFAILSIDIKHSWIICALQDGPLQIMDSLAFSERFQLISTPADGPFDGVHGFVDSGGSVGSLNIYR